MDELEARIEALERAVTDGDSDLSALAAAGETGERLATVETEMEELSDRVAELEAATQALRGYVGNVRAVNREVEQRADAALAKAESVESAIVGDDAGDRPGHGQPDDRRETTAQSGHPAGNGTNGRPTEPQDTPAAGQQADRTGEPAGRPTATDGPVTTAGSPGTESTHDSGRCVTCGRPTAHGGGDGSPADGARGDNTAARGAGGGDTPGTVGTDGPAGGGGGTATATEPGPTGTVTGQSEESETYDPLEGVFEADEPESHSNGRFDRIREML